MVKRLSTPELDHLKGYLGAAQHVFIRGQLDVTLDAALFEIGDDSTDEDVIRAAYPDGFNPIEHHAECSVDEMESDINETLKIAREFWKPEYSTPEIIENNLREGYWQRVKSCFDYTNARIIQLGHHVPFVNIWGGFTYILYAPDKRKCLLLMGNTSD